MSNSILVTERMVAGVTDPIYTWRRGSILPSDTNYYLTIGDADSETTYDGFMKHVIWYADKDGNITFVGNANIEQISFAPGSIDGSLIADNSVLGSKIRNGTIINANITGTADIATYYKTAAGNRSAKTIEQSFKDISSDVGSQVSNIQEIVNQELKKYITTDTLKTEILKSVYPVGSIYTSVQNVNPGTFLGGEWKSIGAGRYLVGADNNHPAGKNGANGNTRSLSAANLPAHNHSISISTADTSHGHTGSSMAAGAHEHDAGSMTISGGFWGGKTNDGQWPWGAFSTIGDDGRLDDGGGHKNTFRTTVFNASKSQGTWGGVTGTSGSHTHTINLDPNSGHTHSHTASCGNTGSGAALNIEPANYAVYFWERVK